MATWYYLLAAVGLEVQSNRILTCLIPDQVAITFSLEVIKELQPVVVAPCLVRLKPFVQFFRRKSRSWTEAAGLRAGLPTGSGGVFFLATMTKVPLWMKMVEVTA